MMSQSKLRIDARHALGGYIVRRSDWYSPMRVTVKENDWKFDAYGQEMTQPPSFSKTPAGGDHTDEIELSSQYHNPRSLFTVLCCNILP